MGTTSSENIASGEDGMLSDELADGGSHYLDYHYSDVSALHNAFCDMLVEKFGDQWMYDKGDVWKWLEENYDETKGEALGIVLNLSTSDIYRRQNEREIFIAVKEMMRLVGDIQKQGVQFIARGILK